MTVNDVDLVTQPNADRLGFVIQPSLASSRLTFQHFNNRDVVTALLAPHNSDARQLDSKEWPPPLLFDVAYGSAALKTWGVPLFVNFVRGRTRGIYYPNNGDDGGVGQSKKCSQKMLDRAARREEKRRVVRQVGNTVDTYDMILALWMHNARKGRRQARAMKAEKTREKVQSWLDSTKD
jgi:hypothetical protein